MIPGNGIKAIRHSLLPAEAHTWSVVHTPDQGACPNASHPAGLPRPPIPPDALGHRHGGHAARLGAAHNAIRGVPVLVKVLQRGWDGGVGAGGLGAVVGGGARIQNKESRANRRSAAGLQHQRGSAAPRVAAMQDKLLRWVQAGQNSKQALRPATGVAQNPLTCVICVVLPEPVSPTTTTTWFSRMTWQGHTRRRQEVSTRRMGKRVMRPLEPQGVGKVGTASHQGSCSWRQCKHRSVWLQHTAMALAYEGPPRNIKQPARWLCRKH